MKTATEEPEQPPRRRWQFSLATLFVLMTITCLVLSRFYPRIYASAEVQVPAMTKATLPTYQQIARANCILTGVFSRHPEFVHTAGPDPVSLIRARLNVDHVEEDILEIRMSGRPAERERLQELVDAIAEEYVGFLVELDGGTRDEVLAALQKAYDDVKAEEGQTSSTAAEDDSEKRDQMLRVLDQRINKIKQEQKKLPPPAKVIRHSSGWDW